jgi:hypothetical protein
MIARTLQSGGWRKPASAAAVLALHALLIVFLIRAGISVPAPAPQSEVETQIVLTRLPPPPPAPKPAEKKTRTHAPALRSVAHATSRAITVPPFFNPTLQGLGAALGCSASNYDALSESQRAACGHGPWHFDSQARETASLTIKPEPYKMTPAEIADHIRRTADPCLPEKAAHLPFCIYTIIYGDKLP